MDLVLKQKLRGLLIKHEGLRLEKYTDSRGFDTIGVGHSLSNPITENAAMGILNDDIAYFVHKLNFPWFENLDSIRQIAVLDMAFNVGINGILEFHQMISALQAKDFKTAALCIMESKWASEVGQRAVDISKIIDTGEL